MDHHRDRRKYYSLSEGKSQVTSKVRTKFVSALLISNKMCKKITRQSHINSEAK